MIDLRPATMADADQLFEWRNDPMTREWSASNAPVERQDHDRWMQFNVLQGYPQHLVMIADSDLGSVGVVRFDAERRDVMRYRVSITMAPKFRGQKLSHGVLAEACRHMLESTLLADIKVANAASRRIFEKCGFEESGKSGQFIQMKREPQV